MGYFSVYRIDSYMTDLPMADESFGWYDTREEATKMLRICLRYINSQRCSSKHLIFDETTMRYRNGDAYICVVEIRIYKSVENFFKQKRTERAEKILEDIRYGAESNKLKLL